MLDRTEVACVDRIGMDASVKLGSWSNCDREVQRFVCDHVRISGVVPTALVLGYGAEMVGVVFPPTDASRLPADHNIVTTLLSYVGMLAVDRALLLQPLSLAAPALASSLPPVPHTLVVDIDCTARGTVMGTSRVWRVGDDRLPAQAISEYAGLGGPVTGSLADALLEYGRNPILDQRRPLMLSHWAREGYSLILNRAYAVRYRIDLN
jgi:hypothetical protein